MPQAEIRKQISIFLPVSDWKVLRQEAARLQIPITELCRRWILPEIEQLQRLTAMPTGSREMNSKERRQ